ncbi:MAG: HEAT repeat domain-containing protein [Candidatus Thorarchaeota archaeon]
MSKISKASKKTVASEKETKVSKKTPTKSTTKKSSKPKTKPTGLKVTKEKKTSGKKADKKKSAPKKTSKKKSMTKSSMEKEREMLGELENEIHSDDEQVCLGAVDRLGSLKHPDATRVLIVALEDPRYMVRIHAAAQLGERKDKKSIDALVESLNDDSVFVRQTVAGALENIGGAKAKMALFKAESEGLLLDELPEGKRLGE